ncbi:MAG: penicillin acylase family protein [Gemmatimonadota bacterium]|nr:penicillin acylase family protein [Gemmatimonadota bacterium]
MTPPRTLSAAIAAVVIAGGIAVTGGTFFLRLSIQPRGGNVDVAGLDEAVFIGYDDHAIPTISAANEDDLFRAQGFVHASERLWQLELFQRIAGGTLAEIFGAPAVDTDRLIRTLDLAGAARAELDGLDPESRRPLEAFAAGVNERIRTWRGPLPPEFLILGIRPQPWSPEASLAIGRIMALDLSGWRSELSRIAAMARIPSSLHPELALEYPQWGPTIMQDPRDDELALPPATGAPVGFAAGDLAGAAPETPFAGWDPLETLASFGLHSSNSWALGGSRTADGHPLLANDMHLSLRAPSTWYLNALHAEAEDLHVAGLSIPGVPGVVVGFNRTVAWGFTNAMVDGGDFVVEGVNLDGSMYRLGDDWAPFETRRETIEVRGEGPVEHTVRSTARGPVITDVVPSAGLTLSLLWVGRERRGAAPALPRMNRARSADEFERALASFQLPHQNVIFVSADGELRYRLAGSLPLRDGADPVEPIPFEVLPAGWPGFVAPEDMPAFRAPATDYLASANNLQSRALFGVVGTRYYLPFRARRIDDVLREARDWTVEDMVALQLDSRSLWAERLRPRAVSAAERIGRDDVADALRSWDLDVSLDSREATWFHLWTYRLRAAIAADELDGAGYFPDAALDRVLASGGSVWVDDVRTGAVESLEQLEEAAMSDALDLADDRVWGAVHFERSEHPLGQLAVLDRLFRFNTGPYPVAGGRSTVRPDDPALWSSLDSAAFEPPFTGSFGPSQRFVARMNPDRPLGYFYLPTGQAGNPLDPRYRSMVHGWPGGAMIEIPLDPSEAEDAERWRLELRPADDS